jgi:hypothetical protein
MLAHNHVPPDVTVWIGRHGHVVTYYVRELLNVVALGNRATASRRARRFLDRMREDSRRSSPRPLVSIRAAAATLIASNPYGQKIGTAEEPVVDTTSQPY